MSPARERRAEIKNKLDSINDQRDKSAILTSLTLNPESDDEIQTNKNEKIDA